MGADEAYLPSPLRPEMLLLGAFRVRISRLRSGRSWRETGRKIRKLFLCEP